MTAPAVMIVEDDRLIAKHLAGTVRKLGYRVAGSTHDGGGALGLILELKPDVVLMDIGLKSGWDGIETARQMNAIYSVPVVFITAYSDTVSRSRAAEARPAGYLVKPFSPEQLRNVLEETVGPGGNTSARRIPRGRLD